MTIIAWRAGIMAADSMVTTGYGVRTGEKQKLSRIRDGVVGFSGKVAYMPGVLIWANTDRSLPPPPKDGDGYSALIATRDHHLFLAEDGFVEELPYDSFRAIGSGAELAFGALHAGASAQDAVNAAISASIYCGGAIRLCRFPFGEIE